MRKKGFPGGLVVKNPSSMQQIQVQSLDQEGPLEKELAVQLPVEFPRKFEFPGKFNW